MSSSFFLLIRKLKDANVYARELARQYSLFRSVSDQVDNTRFKAYSRLKNYRLVFQENATIDQKPASQYEPYVPPEGEPPAPPPGPPPGPSPPGPPPPPPSVQDARFTYPNSAVTAIGNDGNVPANVNDGSLSTRWSDTPLPAWIQVDLGEVKRIAYVRVAWYRGNERTYGYNIQTGAVAGAGMTVRKTGTSAGNTTGFETYDFTDVNARWVVLNVTSNSQNDFASISELEIWGGDDQEPTPPPPGPPGPPAPPSPAPPSPPGVPTPQGTVNMMFTFANTINDSSGQNNHALIDGGTLKFGAGASSATGTALDLNPMSGGGGGGGGTLPTKKTNRIRDWGGPVFNKYSPQIYVIWWGSAWNSGTANSNMNTLRSHMATICNSDHYAGLWEYGFIKKPLAPIHFVDTTALFSGGGMSDWTPTYNRFLALMNNGTIPNPNQHGEPWSAAIPNTTFDYKHMYVIMLPPGKINPPGYYGATSRAFMPTAPFVHWSWSVLNPYDNSSAGGFTAMQNWEQAWAHEMIHQLCHPGMMGCAEGGGFITDTCSSIQHAFANGENCGAGRKTLSGTNVVTEPYWSDMAGKCIAPGSGESWVQPPSGGGGGGGSSGVETFDKIWIPFSNTNRVIIDTSGFSVYASVFPYTVSAPPTAGHMRCIWQKMDDVHNAATGTIGPDGTVYFSLRKDGITYRIRSSPNAVAANAWYQLWFTYNKTTNEMFIYVNGVRHNLSSTVAVLWNGAHSHWFIGNAGSGSTGSPFRGRIDDFRLYRNGTVTPTAVTNMWQNHMTIETIPLGDDYGVAMAGFLKVDSKQINDPFIIPDLVADDILASPPAPPAVAPDGSDDLPPPPVPGPAPPPIQDDFDMDV